MVASSAEQQSLQQSWQAVFFDFDGVITDTLEVKLQAFLGLFHGYDAEIKARVDTYYRQSGGVSRIRKLEYCYEHILKKPLPAADKEVLAHDFSQHIFQGVVDAPLVDGVEETLTSLQEQEIPCFLVSGTPHDELQVLLAAKKLDHFFREMHGSPREKSSIVGDILDRYDIQAGNCLFFGDAMVDFLAAESVGMPFAGIVLPGQPSIFPEGTLVATQVTMPENRPG